MDEERKGMESLLHARPCNHGLANLFCISCLNWLTLALRGQRV